MANSANSATDLATFESDFNSNDPYRVLGLSRSVTQAEIKQAYFALIRKYPPETEGDTFKLIRAAYEKIKDAERRKETDIFLPQPPPTIDLTMYKGFFDSRLQPQDIILVLQCWGDLGRTDFSEDFKEINL
jgi:DnaJ-class molecular chaperone